MNTPEILRLNIDRLYPRLMSEQEMWLREHWSDFNSQKAKLERMVKDEFMVLLGELSPIPAAERVLRNNPDVGSAEILDSRVGYQPPQGKSPGYFFINITKLRLPDGKIMDNDDALSCQNGCPHIYLEKVCGGKMYTERLHPKVKEFVERYNVYHILGPENDCEHG